MDWIMERDRVQVLDEAWNVLAEVTFPVVEPGIVEINHTFVDESLRGQGVAGELLGRAVASIAASGFYARPTCSYAVSWFEKHPEHAVGARPGTACARSRVVYSGPRVVYAVQTFTRFFSLRFRRSATGEKSIKLATLRTTWGSLYTTFLRARRTAPRPPGGRRPGHTQGASPVQPGATARPRWSQSRAGTRQSCPWECARASGCRPRRGPRRQSRSACRTPGACSQGP